MENHLTLSEEHGQSPKNLENIENRYKCGVTKKRNVGGTTGNLGSANGGDTELRQFNKKISIKHILPHYTSQFNIIHTYLNIPCYRNILTFREERGAVRLVFLSTVSIG